MTGPNTGGTGGTGGSTGTAPAATGTAGGGAATPAGTTGNVGTGGSSGATGGGKGGGQQFRAQSVLVRGGPTDNPNAGNDDSENEAYIREGRKRQEKALKDAHKAAGFTAEETQDSIERMKGVPGKSGAAKKKGHAKKK